VQTITSGLLCAEPDLSISSLSVLRTFCQVFKSDLFIIISPSMRKYRIRWDIVDKVLGQAEFAIGFELQKTHHGARTMRGTFECSRQRVSQMNSDVRAYVVSALNIRLQWPLCLRLHK
jgi:hypothetical protein